MPKKPYTTHRAFLTISFDVANGNPEECANEIVKDMIADGYPVILDEVEDVAVGSDGDLRPKFIAPALEAGHGDDFMASFTFTADPDCPEVFVCESVDLLMQRDGTSDWIPIGAVGGEVEIMAVRNIDGSLNMEQMSRNWLGIWHRHFVGATEDSVHGIYLMIKQVVSEGKFAK
jgi:hypothetical protein